MQPCLQCPSSCHSNPFISTSYPHIELFIYLIIDSRSTVHPHVRDLIKEDQLFEWMDHFQFLTSGGEEDVSEVKTLCIGNQYVRLKYPTVFLIFLSFVSTETGHGPGTLLTDVSRTFRVKYSASVKFSSRVQRRRECDNTHRGAIHIPYNMAASVEAGQPMLVGMSETYFASQWWSGFSKSNNCLYPSWGKHYFYTPEYDYFGMWWRCSKARHFQGLIAPLRVIYSRSSRFVIGYSLYS